MKYKISLFFFSLIIFAYTNANAVSGKDLAQYCKAATELSHTGYKPTIIETKDAQACFSFLRLLINNHDELFKDKYLFCIPNGTKLLKLAETINSVDKPQEALDSEASTLTIYALMKAYPCKKHSP
jgi:hypothetical protein